MIDDDSLILEFLTALLEAQKSSASVAFTDPTQALNWCAANNPDLVIVDYQMLSMNGIMFIERFRALPEKTNTPVLMLTADMDRDVRYRALVAGANDFLTKPIDQIELPVRVKNMLALRRSERQLLSAFPTPQPKRADVPTPSAIGN